MTIMNDGYQTTIEFTSAEMDSQANLLTLMEEKEVTPPGVAGGGTRQWCRHRERGEVALAGHRW